jgi:hypothetical protein
MLINILCFRARLVSRRSRSRIAAGGFMSARARALVSTARRRAGNPGNVGLRDRRVTLFVEILAANLFPGIIIDDEAARFRQFAVTDQYSSKASCVAGRTCLICCSDLNGPIALSILDKLNNVHHQRRGSRLVSR